MFSTFQLKRSTRLSLAHQSREVAKTREENEEVEIFDLSFP
jgi:hypothetical protein